MKPEDKKLLEDTAAKVDKLVDLYYRINRIDRHVFRNPVYFEGKIYFDVISFLEDTTVATGTTGLTLGETGDKIGFLGHAPVAQQSAITAPTGGATVDTEARTAINSIRTVMTNFGLTS